MACGLATWENKRAAWEPSAPILLRQATLRPLGAAQDEFELALVDEMEVNPTFQHLLKVDFECDLNAEKLLDRIDGVIDEPWELEETYKWVSEQATRVPGFGIEQRLVLANFAYAKLPMVRDLENAFDELVAHQLIAAIAGDKEAKEKIRSQGPGPGAIPRSDRQPLADEFLVLDADSSQNYAINAILAGESLVIKGPPGTGKSQTIANLIGSLIARDKRVLFVAEKRAAIDAVLKRLNQQKMGDLVLDLHGGVGSRRAFAQAIGQSLVASRTAPRVNNDAELKKVEKRRDELNEYVGALHEPRAPWRLSVYEMRAELVGLESAANEIRFRGDVLDWIDADSETQLEEALAEYARLGGMTFAASATPWVNSPIVSSDEVQRAYAQIDEIRRHTLPTTLAALRPASSTTGLPEASALGEWEQRLDLWEDIRTTLDEYQPSVYEQDLDQLCAELAPAADGGFARFKASMFSAEYKTAREMVRRLRLNSGKARDADLDEACEDARHELSLWRELAGEGIPDAPADVDALRAPYRHLLERLRQVENWTGISDLTDVPVADLEQLLDRLLTDHATLVKLPELHRLETGILATGLGEFLAEMKKRQVSEEFAIQSLRYSWLQSMLDHISLSDLLIGTFTAESHERVIDDFKIGDRTHIETSAARIKRLCAEQAVRVRDANREQEDIVKHQAGLKRRHLPVRDLIGNTADVLLALKPCWAMSPLVVSQLLPPKPYFDVVIFDEASQITPADAIPSILRGRQLVVAGDEKQLPPTAFFVSESPEEEEELEEIETPIPIAAGTKGFESILDSLGSLLRFRMLSWHYRSRDEALIAFSNAHIYDRQLITFPGVGGDHVLRYVPVRWDSQADTNSPSPEVDAVVDLIFEHARTRPDESLGVIAMGIRHANRIEECRIQRLRENPELDEELGDFFTEDTEERFFVKNLERVQGDERDAIILSIGYGKNSRGDLPYRFGPLLTEGGERRLNVAVTRAKNRITLVSSFSSKDMDPERSQAEGVKLLRQYSQYVESGGANLGDNVLEKPALNPFEVDVRDTLVRRGLKLTAQYGTSGYWLDYAIQHPVRPGRYVLAIECDGASYHSSETARDRDRLRQEQLERLGWRFHRIWSSGWFHNKERCVDKALAAYELAVAAADRKEQEQGEDASPRHRTTNGNTGSHISPGEEGDAAPLVVRNGPRPPLRRGLSITEYSQSQLVQMIRWVESDDRLRTEDELLDETIRELGFQKRGSRIVTAINQAIRHARR